MKNLFGAAPADEESRRRPISGYTARGIINKEGEMVMTQIITDHGMSWCFGTSLAPERLEATSSLRISGSSTHKQPNRMRNRIPDRPKMGTEDSVSL